jgi:hypothetical protein
VALIEKKSNFEFQKYGNMEQHIEGAYGFK